MSALERRDVLDFEVRILQDMMNTKVAILVWAAAFAVCLLDVVSGQGASCLRCICQVEGCQIGRCRMDGGSLSCGPYQIHEAYWIDCGRPGGDYRRCTMSRDCSERCINAYMDRYARRCTGGREPTCRDYAKIHNGGPNGCRSSNDNYWNRVRRCLGQ